MPNVLVIVEGKKTEPAFFKQLHTVFGLDYNIFCFATNIYTLYRRIKDLDFNCDIKNVLKEHCPEQALTLNNKFAYTYLIFDCDAHHTKPEDERKTEQIVLENFQKLQDLLKYFNDETDPSKGKLYINYPMMESFKDADDFFESKYCETTVNINEICKYKDKVNKKMLSRRRVDSLTKEQLEQLTLMNVYKLNFIVNSKWDKLSYAAYQRIATSLSLHKSQEALIKQKNEISVINTTLFIILDYFGNQNGFYDSIINK